MRARRATKRSVAPQSRRSANRCFSASNVRSMSCHVTTLPSSSHSSILLLRRRRRCPPRRPLRLLCARAVCRRRLCHDRLYRPLRRQRVRSRRHAMRCRRRIWRRRRGPVRRRPRCECRVAARRRTARFRETIRRARRPVVRIATTVRLEAPMACHRRRHRRLPIRSTCSCRCCRRTPSRTRPPTWFHHHRLNRHRHSCHRRSSQTPPPPPRALLPVVVFRRQRAAVAHCRQFSAALRHWQCVARRPPQARRSRTRASATLAPPTRRAPSPSRPILRRHCRAE